MDYFLFGTGWLGGPDTGLRPVLPVGSPDGSITATAPRSIFRFARSLFILSSFFSFSLNHTPFFFFFPPPTKLNSKKRLDALFLIFILTIFYFILFIYSS